MCGGWHVAIIVTVGLVVALTILAVRSPRLDQLLVAWCCAYLVFELATDNMRGGELRMLLPLFPLVAVACGVASARPAHRWRLRSGLLIAVGIAGQHAWVLLFVRFLPGVSRPP